MNGDDGGPPAEHAVPVPERSGENSAGRARPRVPAISILLIAVGLAAAAALGSLTLRGPAGPTNLQDRARIVAQGLRCPSCQSLSVADSPSAIAGEIRRDIARRLAAGGSASEIRAYYVSRYGPWILLSPPRSGMTLFAWILPLLFVTAGLTAAIVALRRWTVGGLAQRQVPLADGTDGVANDVDRLSAADRVLLDRARAGLSTAEDPE